MTHQFGISRYPIFNAGVCDGIPGVTLFNTGSAILLCCWDGSTSGPFGGLVGALTGDLRRNALSNCLHVQLSVLGPPERDAGRYPPALQLRFDADACVTTMQVRERACMLLSTPVRE